MSTFIDKLNVNISLLNDLTDDLQKAQDGKMKPATRARKDLLIVARSLNDLRKELLENTKAVKEKRKQEAENNPVKKLK